MDEVLGMKWYWVEWTIWPVWSRAQLIALHKAKGRLNHIDQGTDKVQSTSAVQAKKDFLANHPPMPVQQDGRAGMKFTVESLEAWKLSQVERVQES